MVEPHSSEGVVGNREREEEIPHMLTNIRAIIGQTRGVFGYRKEEAIEPKVESSLARELATLRAIRLADMAGLGALADR